MTPRPCRSDTTGCATDVRRANAIEYTARILRREPAGYLVPGSVVLHKTKAPYTAVSTTGDRFYFHIRNHVFMLRGTSWAWWEKPRLIYLMLKTSLSYMRRNRWRPT